MFGIGGKVKTRSDMNGSLYLRLICALFLITLSAAPSFAAAKDDPCKEEGIIVKNLSTRDLWYRKDGGPCFYWDKNKTFVIRPGEKIEIFSDLVCRTNYCKDNPSYKDYRNVDSNGNCAVAIHPGCKISDM
jgi:hypothetical protein